MKYKLYYLENKDFSQPESLYVDYRKLLREVDEDGVFVQKEDAVKRAEELTDKNTEVVILEVY